MTKFEEEAMNEFAKSEYVYTAYDGTFRGETDGTVMEFAKGTAIYTFPWLELAKNWHSDEEYQELLKENNKLKSQLQQQALPVVPECVAEFIDESKGNLSLYGALFFICDNTNKELNNWVFREANQNLFARAWLDGYTVEKPQLFYLKNKLTNSYLCQYPSDKSFYHIVVDDDGISKLVTKFTKQEIDSMQTGSYELVLVEDGE